MASSSGASGSGAPVSAPTPPDDLKVIAPFLQRAHETRKADPPLSYWCTYHAAQMGIARMGAIKPASKGFLVSLMDALETQKKELAGNDIVHGDDIVAKAHIENVALKVFAGADAEDRAGKATKATARRFLVAGNFIEVLTNFGPLDSEMDEKLKYAKWKAADISKALREGREPVPGPAGGLPEEELLDGDAGAATTLAGLDDAGARLGGLHPDSATLPSKEELDAEMARLTSGEGDFDSPRLSSGTPKVEHKGLAISPSVEPLRPAAQPSRLSFETRNDQELSGPDSPATSSQSPDARPNFSKPMRMSSYMGSDGQVNAAAQQAGLAGYNASVVEDPSTARDAGFLSQQGASEDALPHSRDPTFVQQPDLTRHESASSIRPPLPHPPQPSALQPGTPRSPLPLPPQSQFPNDPFIPAQHPSQPPLTAFHQHAHPSAPPAAHETPTALPATQRAAPTTGMHHQPPTAPVPNPASMPSSLDSAQTSRVQKLAKWAVSALDYDDVETARKQLREALDICEGRAQAQNGKR